MGFFSTVHRFSGKSIQEAKKLRRQVIYELFSSVVLLTPVDMGRARGNWIYSDRMPDFSTTTERTDKTGSRLLSRLISQLSGEDGVYNLNNNLDYIGPLEEGGSKQAPYGMMGPSVERIRRNLSRLR